MKTAGDLLCETVDKWVCHLATCPDDEDCATCATGFNQIRLAWKVWKASGHKVVSVGELPRTAFESWLRRYVTDRGQALAPSEFYAAQAAFFAAYPVQGTTSTAMEIESDGERFSDE